MSLWKVAARGRETRDALRKQRPLSSRRRVRGVLWCIIYKFTVLQLTRRHIASRPSRAFAARENRGCAWRWKNRHLLKKKVHVPLNALNSLIPALQTANAPREEEDNYKDYQACRVRRKAARTRKFRNVCWLQNYYECWLWTHKFRKTNGEIVRLIQQFPDESPRESLRENATFVMREPTIISPLMTVNWFHRQRGQTGAFILTVRNRVRPGDPAEAPMSHSTQTAVKMQNYEIQYADRQAVDRYWRLSRNTKPLPASERDRSYISPANKLFVFGTVHSNRQDKYYNAWFLSLSLSHYC